MIAFDVNGWRCCAVVVLGRKSCTNNSSPKKIAPNVCNYMIGNNYTSIARQKYARQFYQLYSIQATGISKWQTKHTWATTKRKGKKLQSKVDLTCTAYANWNEPIYPVYICVCVWECRKQVQSQPNARDHFPNNVLQIISNGSTAWHDTIWYDMIKEWETAIRATCARSRNKIAVTRWSLRHVTNTKMLSWFLRS